MVTDFDTRAWLDAQPEERRDIWSSVEWGLWGSGLGDVLREPVAATMVDALSDEQVADVHATMAAWQEHKAKQGSHPGWEELAKAKAEIERLRTELASAVARVAGWRGSFGDPATAGWAWLDSASEDGTTCTARAGRYGGRETFRCDKAAGHRDGHHWAAEAVSGVH